MATADNSNESPLCIDSATKYARCSRRSYAGATTYAVIGAGWPSRSPPDQQRGMRVEQCWLQWLCETVCPSVCVSVCVVVGENHK